MSLGIGQAQLVEDFRDTVKHYKKQEVHDAALLNTLQNIDWNRLKGEDVVIQSEYSEVSQTCVDAAALFFTGLARGEPWAITMIDAAGKLPRSLLLGRFRWMGDYDSCTGIETSDNGVAFTGQYCAGIFGNTTAQLGGVNVGICFPSTCTFDEWMTVFNNVSQNIQIWPKDIGLVAGVCQPVEPPPFDAGTWVMAIIVVIIFLLVTSATFYDIILYQSQLKKKGQKDVNVPIWARLLMAFSIYTNTKKLLHVAPTGSSNLKVLTGIRFFSIGWIIIGHYLVIMMSTVENTEIIDQSARKFSFQIVMGAELAVDSFFLLSGLLVCYMIMKQFDKCGGPRGMGVFGWVHFYVHRWWRLTPAVILIAALMATLLIYTGDGPNWIPFDAYQETNFCRENWWTNFLYINNLVNAKEMCMGWTWYLACDMQFYIVSPLFLIPLYMQWKVGIALIVATWLASDVGRGVMSALNDTPLGVAGRFFYPEDHPDHYYDTYIVPWFRIGPYMIGLLTGYFMYCTKLKCKLPSFVVYLGWLLSFVVSFAIMFGPYSQSKEDVNTPRGAINFYNAIFRSTWSACVAWVIFASVNGYGGFVNTFLSWKPFVVLSRLNYMAYNMHSLVLFHFFFSRRYFIYVDTMDIIAFYIAIYVMTYFWSYLASMTLEVPFVGIEKVLMGGRGGGKPTEDKKPVPKSAVEPLTDSKTAESAVEPVTDTKPTIAESTVDYKVSITVEPEVVTKF